MYYTNHEEFAETLRLLESNRRLRTGLGANGRRYFRQHYAWPVIEQKYLELLQQLQRDGDAAPRRRDGAAARLACAAAAAAAAG